MTEWRTVLKDLGVDVPAVLLPAPGINMRRWAVVACDQYSSERHYWERVEGFVGDAPSALHCIFPECYLEDKDSDQRIGRIQRTMERYLSAGYLASPGEGFVLLERRTPFESSPRIGLLSLLDLERYDYGKNSESLIRPTEGTILSRLPSRMAIRREAALELPHVMVLVDDPAKSLIEPLYAKREYFSRLYDFELMEGGGHVAAWHIHDESSMAGIANALSALADPQAFQQRHGKGKPLLFAVGDGNHSLATAKAIWEETKKSLTLHPGKAEVSASMLAAHPARYALVELLNIYDPGLPFHPIHRMLFNVDEAEFFAALRSRGVERMDCPDAGEAFRLCDEADPQAAHRIAWVKGRRAGILRFLHPESRMAVGSLQDFLDEYLARNPATRIDYIHGSGSLKALAEKPGNLGLYCPPVDKRSFFSTIVRDGVMPRKSFSMGEAPEKRFYIEARKIRP